MSCARRKVLAAIRQRAEGGVNDILIAVVDGLHGFPKAITMQTRIVHLIRNRLAFVSWEDRKAIPASKAIYRERRRRRLLGQIWRNAWDTSYRSSRSCRTSAR
ncbi:transposase [Bradyrhizobium sp. Pear76]|uniref:transposase n=1 Tax=Bradyrhizobium oropedii TaxID=1571201 RepID=UPI003B8472B0|nr:transposase [Bradyrhizobium oropedii]